MNLRTVKMVTFLLLMEEGAGVMDKEPEEIWNTWNAVNSFSSPEQLRAYLGPDRTHRLENYIQVWGAAPKPAAAPPPFVAEPEPPAAGAAALQATDAQEVHDVPGNSA